MLVSKDDYLMHYGVKGMKWGHRKNPEVAAARANYKSAKTDLTSANRAYNRASRRAIGIKGIQQYEKAQANRNKARTNYIDSKVAYKVSKAKDSKKDKVEFKAYKKEMGKSGIRGSAADSAHQGRSTDIYNSIKAKKGKEYADRVEKRIQNEAYAKIAVSGAVLVGSQAVSMYLNSKR